MKYVAHIRASGEGCDYTIGCNHAFVQLKATTPDDARREALEYTPVGEDIGNGRMRRAVKSIVIYEVASEINMDADIAAEMTRLEQKQAADARAAKQAQIERLKRELGE